MAKRVIQFRYYNETDSKNFPQRSNDTQILFNDYIEGTVFQDYKPIAQLGIQSLPGTKFYLNGHLESPIVVGTSGIYDLDIKNGARVRDLQFDAGSMKRIVENDSAYLLVDILYGEDD